MRVREIFATHLSLTERPLRVQCKEGLSRIRVDAEQGEVIVRLLGAIFFPKDTKTEDLAALLGGERYECGLVLSVGEQALRVRRGVEPDSIRLQLMDTAGRFQTQYEGEEQVAEALKTYFHLEDPLLFRVFNLGEYGALAELGADIAPEAADGDDSEWGDLGWEEETELRVSALGPGPLGASKALGMAMRYGADAGEIARLQTEYRFAREAEVLDGRAAEVRRELVDVQAQLDALSPQATEGEELRALRQAVAEKPGSGMIRKRDWQVLSHPEEQLRERERHVAVLSQRVERLIAAPAGARPVWKNPVFGAGLVFTLVCTLVAVLGGPSLRGAALGNVLFLGFSLFGVLVFLRDQDAVFQRGLQLRSAEAELSSNQETLETYQVELAEARSRLMVASAVELRERERQRARLAELEKVVAEARRRAHEDPGYVALAARRHRLQEGLDELVARRESLGALDHSAEEIAALLTSMEAPLEPQPAPRTPSGSIGTVLGTSSLNTFDPFPALMRVAERVGLAVEEGLEEATLEIWEKALAPLLDEKISLDLTRAGELFLNESEEIGVWLRLSEWQRLVCVETLVLAMALRLLDLKSEMCPAPLLFRFQPFSSLPPTKSPGLLQLYKTIGASFQVVVFDKALGR